jgi:hypothetical protein
MIPSPELRLRTMMRSLTEVILPSLDQNNALAQEQGRLLLGHLHALLLQQPHAQRVERVDARALENLGQRLIDACAGGPITMAAAARVTAAITSGDHATLSHAIERLIVDSALDGSPAFLRTAEALVLADAKATSLRGRTWFKPMGFDADPDSLPDISTLLTTQEHSHDQT